MFHQLVDFIDHMWPIVVSRIMESYISRESG